MTKAKLQNKRNAGFTLIELLVVIGILAVLLAIVLIAINPGRQFGQANDTKRRSDVSAILNAVGAYAADHAGALPAGIPTDTAVPPVGENMASGGVDLCDNILVPNYISALPADPKNGSYTNCANYDLQYFISQDNNHRVTVSATKETADQPDITATR